MTKKERKQLMKNIEKSWLDNLKKHYPHMTKQQRLKALIINKQTNKKGE